MKRVSVRGITVQTGNIVKDTVIEGGRVITTFARVEYIRERIGCYSSVLISDVIYKSVKR